MKLKYDGRAHERSFTKSDFKSVGLKNGTALKFNEDNNYIAEVDDEVAAWLLANEAPDFREATEKDEEVQDTSRPGAVPRALKAVIVSEDEDELELADSDDATRTGPQAGQGPSGGVKKAGASSTRRT